MKIKFLRFLSLTVLTAVMMLPFFVFADTTAGGSGGYNLSNSLDKLTTVGSTVGYSSAITVQVIVGQIIRAALSLLGVIFIILLVIGGYNWMMAEGNEQKVEKAQNYIRRAIIGLIITLSTWSIWNFIVARFS